MLLGKIQSLNEIKFKLDQDQSGGGSRVDRLIRHLKMIKDADMSNPKIAAVRSKILSKLDYEFGY